MRLRSIAFAIFSLLALFEVLEYYAVSTTEFTYLEVIGAERDEGLRILLRGYISKPNPLPVRILALRTVLECNGVRVDSETGNITVFSRDYTFPMELRAPLGISGHCSVHIHALLTTNLLWIIGAGIATRNRSAYFDSAVLLRPLLWGGWNATAISAGQCCEIIVIANPSTRYIMRVYEEYYGQPAKVILEETASGNLSKLFCVPPGTSPLVVKGYYISLEDVSKGIRIDQANSYPPRLKLRG